MPIIGRGSIAQIITDREGFIFFAAGESNRTPYNDFRGSQERGKFIDAITSDQFDGSQMFVYFSGLNIYYPEGERRNDYTEHKLRMEGAVKRCCENYCILRLGSITWGDNPNTLVNALKAKVAADPTYTGSPVFRYLHTISELQHWFGMIPRYGKHEMNITGALTWVPELVERIKRGEI